MPKYFAYVKEGVVREGPMELPSDWRHIKGLNTLPPKMLAGYGWYPVVLPDCCVDKPLGVLKKEMEFIFVEARQEVVAERVYPEGPELQKMLLRQLQETTLKGTVQPVASQALGRGVYHYPAMHLHGFAVIGSIILDRDMYVPCMRNPTQFDIAPQLHTPDQLRVLLSDVLDQRDKFAIIELEFSEKIGGISTPEEARDLVREQLRVLDA